MDKREVADLALAVVSLGVWALIYAIARLVTRPVSPAAAPATMELGPEPPALVSLLVNRWALTEDAAESTLLDLAARKFFELRQPGNDPRQTTVHVPARSPEAGGLRAYEKQVLDRVRGLAVDGVVPLSALTFRDAGQAQAWNKRLRASVIADARSAGLSRRRFGKGVTTLLSVAAAGAAIGVGLAAFDYGVFNPSKESSNPGIRHRDHHLRPARADRRADPRRTRHPAGRTVAAHWLGVRDWLRGHEQFADLPPAAVAVWDAISATAPRSARPTCQRDPRPGHGRPAAGLVVVRWDVAPDPGPLSAVLAALRAHAAADRRPGPALPFRRGCAAEAARLAVTGFAPGTDQWGHLVVTAITALGPLLVAPGAYILVRSLLDLVTVRTITGEVLWVEVWESSGGGGGFAARTVVALPGDR